MFAGARFHLPPLAAGWVFVLAGHATALAALPWGAASACRVVAAALGVAALTLGRGALRTFPLGAANALRRSIALAAAIGSLAAAGAALGLEGACDRVPLEAHPRPVPAELTGFVADAGGSSETPATVTFDVRRARVGERERPTRGTVRLRWASGSPPPLWAAAGTALRVRGLFRGPEDARHAGGSAPGRYLEREGIAGTLDVAPEGVDAWIDVGAERGEDRAAWPRLAAEARRAIARRLDAVSGPDASALARGMLLGDRAGIEPSLRDSFRNAGTLHILSISGLHVCIVAAFLAVLARMAGLGAGAGTAAELIGLAAYVLFVGAPAPALRSAFLWSLMRGARLLGRGTTPLAGWGAAGLILHVARPTLTQDPGFALSFAAVLGLEAGSALAPAREAASRGGRLRRWAQGAAAAVAAGLGAAVGTLPIEAVAFGAIPVAGPIANLAVIPLTTLFLAEAILVSAAGWILPGALLSMTGGALDAAASLLIATNRALGGGVDPVVLHAGAPLGSAALSYLALFAIAGLRGRRAARAGDRARVRWIALGLLAGAALAPMAAARAVEWSRAPRAPSFVALDVGQGDAAYLIGTQGEALLVDAGPRSARRDEGRSVVEPALRAERLRRGIAAVSSHGHRDHEGGLPWLARRGWISRVFENGGGSPERNDWRRALAQRGGGAALPAAEGTPVALRGWDVRIDPPRAGRDPARAPHRLDAGSAGRLGSANAAENDRSLVAFARGNGGESGSWSILLPGDLEHAGEEAWLASRLLGPTDVLKVPHHGSRTSSTEAWVACLRPRAAIISAGEANRHGHPSPMTVTRYRRAGAWVLRTDREGSIRITAFAGRLWVSTRAHPLPRPLPARSDSAISPCFDFP